VAKTLLFLFETSSVVRSQLLKTDPSSKEKQSKSLAFPLLMDIVKREIKEKSIKIRLY